MNILERLRIPLDVGMTGNRNSLSAALAIAQIDAEIRRRGLTYELYFDCDLLQETAATLEGKELTDDFDGRQFDLHEANFFWIALYDKDERCVSIQAARVEDLQSRTLAAHWNTQQRRKAANQVDPGEFELGKEHCLGAFEITGRVAYHGDFWVHEQHRGDGFSEALVHMGFFIGLLHWNYDWIYGLMHTEGVYAGFHSRAGYRMAEPFSVDWKKTPPIDHIRDDDWLVASPRSYVEYSARQISKLGLARTPYMRRR